MNLTYGATFPLALLKRAKHIFNEINKIHMTQIDTYVKLQSTMVRTYRLYRCCVRNVMVNLFSKKI